MEDLIRNTFGPEQGPSAVLVYVGQRSKWVLPSDTGCQAVSMVGIDGRHLTISSAKSHGKFRLSRLSSSWTK